MYFHNFISHAGTLHMGQDHDYIFYKLYYSTKLSLIYQNVVQVYRFPLTRYIIFHFPVAIYQEDYRS